MQGIQKWKPELWITTYSFKGKDTTDQFSVLTPHRLPPQPFFFQTDMEPGLFWIGGVHLKEIIDQSTPF